MGRAAKLIAVFVVVLVALIAINASVLGSQTKRAEVNTTGAELIDTATAELQVVDQPASGSGPERGPIVLLHCYACSLQWWDQVVPLLNRDHRLIRIDLIGFGGSEKPASGYEIEAQAGAVAQVLNALGVEAATVVGHSMGGFVATALASQSSQLVDRVAVIGTPSTTQASELPLTARLGYTPLIGPAMWRVRTDGLIRSGYEEAFAPGFDYESAFADPDQVVLDNRAMTYTSYDAASAAGRDFIDEQSLASRLTAASVPFLAILGSEDQIVDTPLTEQELSAVPGATVRVLEGAGHSPNLELPQDTAELLLRFAGAAPAPTPAPAENTREAEMDDTAKPKPAKTKSAKNKATKKKQQRAKQNKPQKQQKKKKKKS